MTFIRTPISHEAALTADDDIFGAALAGQAGFLQRSAVRLCGSPTEAEDLVQQTLLKAWSHRRNFAADSNLKAWLRAILRNEFLDGRRRASRQPTQSLVETEDPPIAANQEWLAALRETCEHLGRLPPEQAQALILVGLLGYGHEQAGHLSHCAVGTMKSRVSRGRAGLRRSLDAIASA